MPYPLPETPYEVEYEFVCIHAPTCDVLADHHGRECEAVNQQGREEFYADVLKSSTLGDLL